MDSKISNYKRMIRSTQAEQILSTSKIKINVDKLRPHVIGSKKDSEVYKYMKNASQGNGFIQSEYDSMGKITARMFTRKGSLNLITLSDDKVLKSMDSRYPDGQIVVIDYTAFEPSIICSLLGKVMPLDIHGWACTLFPNIPRNVLKLWNMRLLYSKEYDIMIQKLNDVLTNEFNTHELQINVYIHTMRKIRNAIEDYVNSHKDEFGVNGYVLNSYGRKIYPKEQGNIFNNIIQSIGSEILIEIIIKLHDFLGGKEAHIMFHRFDALYFDISRDALFSHLGGIIKIMESINDSIDLKVGIKIGGDLTSLKELDIG